MAESGVLLLLRRLQDVVTSIDRRVATLEANESYALPTIRLQDGVTAPDTETGVVSIWTDSTSGDLKIKFGNGTTKTIITD